MVERQLPKLDVAGSSPVFRSIPIKSGPYRGKNGSDFVLYGLKAMINRQRNAQKVKLLRKICYIIQARVQIWIGYREYKTQ